MSLKACIFATLAAVAGVSTAAPTAADSGIDQLSRRQVNFNAPQVSYSGPSGSISIVPGTSSADRNFILSEHNNMRARVGVPTALVYDLGLECVARKWLEESRNTGLTGMNFRHSSELYGSAWYQNAFALCKSRGYITDAQFNNIQGWLGENWYSGSIRGTDPNFSPSAVTSWTTFRNPNWNLGRDGTPCSEQEAAFANSGNVNFARCQGATDGHYLQVTNRNTVRVGCAYDPVVGTICNYF